MDNKEKLRITRLLGVGVPLQDIRIGYLGTENGWYPPYCNGTWMDGGLERFIVSLCRERNIELEDTNPYWQQQRGYYHYENREYNISYDVDCSG